jgi:hypothetical protein
MSHWILPGTDTQCYVLVRAGEEMPFRQYKSASLKTVDGMLGTWSTSERAILQDIYQTTSSANQSRGRPSSEQLEEVLRRQLKFGALLAFESQRQVIELQPVVVHSVSKKAAPTSPAQLAKGSTSASPQAVKQVSSPSSGDWTDSDREQNNRRWQEACRVNLLANNFRRYTRIIERRDFYRWFYKSTFDRGYTTRWALAASIVANGAYEVAIMGMFLENMGRTFGTVNNELQGMMREGNQVIFDNVFPKLRQLWLGGPLVGRAALDWDMRILSEEQTLIQPLYKGVSTSTVEKLEQIARKQGLPGTAASVMSKDAVQPEPPYIRGGVVPAFTGAAITSIHDRWLYGMSLGDLFTPGGTGFNPAVHTRPAPATNYGNGVELTRVRIRPNLHQLDATLDGSGSGTPWLKNEVTAILRRLTRDEQTELLRDQKPDGGRYSDACFRAHVAVRGSYRDLVARVVTWRVNLEAQMQFLDRFMKGYGRGAWSLLNYRELSPMIRAFTQAEKTRLHTSYWRDVFISVCDDRSIVTAATELGLPASLRREWIEEEESWF